MTRRKQRLLISAGGTATTWHLSSLVREVFPDHFELLVCDIYPPHLVASSRLAQRCFQVPPVADPGYRAHMLALFAAEGIDLYVPLIDADVYEFPSDDPSLEALGVRSTGAVAASAPLLRNKRVLAEFLDRHGIVVPGRLVEEDLSTRPPDERVFVKPEKGFGSRGAGVATVAAARARLRDEEGLVVQALCRPPEITVEVFNGTTGVRALCRERLETKEGVCTKARIWWDEELEALARHLCTVLALPVAFCFQVLRDDRGRWTVVDLNPRLGAGTALSTAYGWSLASAALAAWGRLDLAPEDFLRLQPEERHVLRVYSEIVMP
ncbi:MAG: ATP-grasp domain-containing protein [Alphaproteobacteria bacterium]